jgi:hypothetical protein
MPSLTRSTIAKIESGVRTFVTVAEAATLAQALSTSPADLIGSFTRPLAEPVESLVTGDVLQESVTFRPRTGAQRPAGRPLDEVTDPFGLEVHRPVQADDPPQGLTLLPTYMPREHDLQMAEVVQAAAEGVSGIAVLVGGSSTGKTRACWEALGPLRGRPEPWRLWHPIDPSRPEAALRELPSVGPRTVIWLNEAQFYLDAPADGLGERVAAGLRELLRDPGRAPVLVLGTMWPQFWEQLTARPPAAAGDPHAQTRELLAGRDIAVPSAFSADLLRELVSTIDPRLVVATQMAEGGRVAQFLAGAPELMARYRNAPPAAAALINAAIDARRLGMGIGLPLAFLEAAAPGYLTSDDWDTLSDGWLEQALAYTAAPCKGTRGPLTRIRPRTTTASTGPAYRLADYLEQHGRQSRRLLIPTADFWMAAARYASSDDLPALAEAAEKRGLLRDAARLRKHAAGKGNANEAATLVRNWHSQHPGSEDIGAAAQWAAAHAALDNPYAAARLLGALREAGAEGQVATLLARDPATHAGLSNPYATARLLGALREVGAEEQVARLAARAGAHTALDNPDATARLLNGLREVGAEEQVARLAARASAYAALDNPYATARLLGALREVGAEEQVATLLARDPAAQVSLGNPGDIARLLHALREVGAEEHVATLAARSATHAALGSPGDVAWLLNALLEVGAEQEVATLLARDPAAHAPLDDPSGVAWLLNALLEVGAEQQVTTLAARTAAYAPLHDPFSVARLLSALRESGAEEQVATLLARDPAAQVSVGNPGDVAWLLDVLRWSGAEGQVATLAARAASHSAPDDVAGALSPLSGRGVEDRVRTLVDILPAEGHFGLFHEQTEHQGPYLFGREPDGSPAPPWGWDDLD